MKILFRFLFLGFFLLWASVGWSLDPQIKRLENKPLMNLAPPPLTIRTLSNGMKVYLLEDHELSVFQIFAYVRGGSIQDPADEVGLASLMANLLRTGGTQKKKVEEIDRFLENHGAALETGMTREYGTAYLQGLSKDLRPLLSLFFEILSSPRFEAGQVDLTKKRMIESLKRQNDEPEKIALREYPKLIYGPKSVWARTPHEKSLNRISRQDLLHFHQRFFHPDRIILAISGDFKAGELFKWLEQDTRFWKPATEALPKIPEVQKIEKGGVAGIQKPGVQSTVLMGHFGDKRFNPDKFALILMNYMLGGDIFSSRLGEEVRSNRGLAYSVFSHFGLETDYGLFYVLAQTRSEKTGEVVGLVEKEVRHFHKGFGFSETHLRFAKESILNQLVGDWEPLFNYVKERARLGFYGYPENYLEIYRQKISAVTLKEVKEVAKKYLFPDQIQILVVGDLKGLEGQLKKFGEVKEIPLDGF